MADYRLSAQVIKRSDGKSSVASAAYRAAERLEDHRTGEIHNYAPKGGVEHSEILAPDNTPEWMLKRQDLWNAVEKIERRKDAQLAREIQLSLPHELTPEQRRELVQDFVKDQFVDHGMIADVAIHSPNPKGDERNHHAHIMLTMRELTADGFGKKNRDWNSRETVNRWREEWANHQNRSLERHGHDARVDHRSYEDQGIDREPTQHRGNSASAMEARGKKTRIGDKNRHIQLDNAQRANNHAHSALLASQIVMERAKFAQWAKERRDKAEQVKQGAEQSLAKGQKAEISNLLDNLNAANGVAKSTIAKEIEQVTSRLDNAKGVKKTIRDVFGRTRQDKHKATVLQKSLKKIEQREKLQIERLERKHALELKKKAEQQQARKDRVEGRISRIRTEREKDGWGPRSKRDQIRPRTTVQPSNDPTPTVGAPKAEKPIREQPGAKKPKSLDELWAQAKSNQKKAPSAYGRDSEREQEQDRSQGRGRHRSPYNKEPE